MEYIEGAPLKGPLPADQALKYAAQICDALDAAHKKGITHRDLKPANILVTKAGIKLLDFGLAELPTPRIGQVPKPADATLTMALTGKNEIVGTLYYMSPEQLQAQADGQEIDGRHTLLPLGYGFDGRAVKRQTIPTTSSLTFPGRSWRGLGFRPGLSRRLFGAGDPTIRQLASARASSPLVVMRA